MKIDRLLSITLILINRPMVTAKELCERFDVSLRTIYRDIESIAAAGIPVSSSQGKGGGYSLIENYRVDRQLLSLNDMISILTALKGINTSLNNSDIFNAIDKIESLVPDDKLTHVNKHFENIIIDLSPWYDVENQKIMMEMIHSAIRECQLINFNYRNLKGEQTNRQIEPMSLVLKVWCWYCYGYCTEKKDYRLFRLSRMSGCSVLDTKFIRRLSKFTETNLLKKDPRPVVAMKLRFSPNSQNLIEEFFFSCKKEIDNEGFYLISVEYPQDEWVFSTILGFGDACEVLSPLELRTIIASRLKKASSFYNS